MKLKTLNTCVQKCQELDVSCPNNDCRNWIDYEEDFNCVHIAVKKNGSMTLREISKRLDCSFVRVKQIEEEVLKKIKDRIDKENYL